jgi:hypothetical protein
MGIQKNRSESSSNPQGRDNKWLILVPFGSEPLLKVIWLSTCQPLERVLELYRASISQPFATPPIIPAIVTRCCNC